MKQYFEYKDEKSAKFWQIELEDNNIQTYYGKIGAEGRSTEKELADKEKAEKEYNKLVAKKIKEGYIEIEIKEPVAFGVFQLLTVEELYEEYEDELPAELKRIYNEDTHPKRGLLLCNGDAFINGHLSLGGISCQELSNVLNIEGIDDFSDDYLDYAPTAIMVLGNLEVRGSIQNKYGYSVFFVKGNVKTKNIIAGNGFLYIEGDLNVSDALVEYYNDGELHVKGKTTAALRIEDDHAVNYFGGLSLKYQSFKEAQKAKVLVKGIQQDEVLDLIDEGEYIFNDSSKDIIKDYNYWLKYVAKDGVRLKSVPKRYIDLNLIKRALTSNVYSLLYVPSTFINKDFIDEVVDMDPSSITLIPEEYITKDLCLKCVKRDGHLINKIPAEYIDYDLCKSVVKLEGALISIIPFSYIDKNLCILAAENGAGIKNIRSCFLDEDIICKIIQNQPDSIEYIDLKNVTFKVALTAAKLGRLPIDKYGSDNVFELYDEILVIGIENIGLEAIKDGVEILDKLPPYLITQKVYDAAKKLYNHGDTQARWEEIEKHHSLDFYKYIYPEANLAANDDLKYGESSGDVKYFANHVWNVFITPEYVHEAIDVIFRKSSNQDTFFRWLSRDLLTPEDGFKIIASSHHNCKELPLSAFDYKTAELAIATNAYGIEYIPDELIDPELCMLVVSKKETQFGTSDGSGYHLRDVPYQYRTEEICKEALLDDERAKSNIPQKYQYLFEDNDNK